MAMTGLPFQSAHSSWPSARQRPQGDLVVAPDQVAGCEPGNPVQPRKERGRVEAGLTDLGRQKFLVRNHAQLAALDPVGHVRLILHDEHDRADPRQMLLDGAQCEAQFPKSAGLAGDGFVAMRRDVALPEAWRLGVDIGNDEIDGRITDGRITDGRPPRGFGLHHRESGPASTAGSPISTSA